MASKWYEAIYEQPDGHVNWHVFTAKNISAAYASAKAWTDERGYTLRGVSEQVEP
jgi:hypothetical protein